VEFHRNSIWITRGDIAIGVMSDGGSADRGRGVGMDPSQLFNNATTLANQMPRANAVYDTTVNQKIARFSVAAKNHNKFLVAFDFPSKDTFFKYVNVNLKIFFW
jgi:hypothetical protein